jgi:hypothetical protein
VLGGEPDAVGPEGEALDVAVAVVVDPPVERGAEIAGRSGVVLTWGVVDGGGFVTGVPLAIIAIVLGIRSRPSGKATAAIVIGSVCLLFVAACTAFWA